MACIGRRWRERQHISIGCCRGGHFSNARLEEVGKFVGIGRENERVNTQWLRFFFFLRGISSSTLEPNCDDATVALAHGQSLDIKQTVRAENVDSIRTLSMLAYNHQLVLCDNERARKESGQLSIFLIY